jgi:hypothetical protein
MGNMFRHIASVNNKSLEIALLMNVGESNGFAQIVAIVWSVPIFT